MRGSVILLRVVDWLRANRGRLCVAISTAEFMTPDAAWEESGGSALEGLYQAPEGILGHLHIFLSGWVGVQEATSYILTSLLSLTVVARLHVDAPQNGFVLYSQRSVRGCPTR